MLRKWMWVIAYLIAAAAVFGVGMLVAQLPLYQQMVVPALPRLTAARLAEIAAMAGAIFVLWLAVRRLALQFYRGGWRQAYAGALLLPAGTLLIMALGQAAMRPVLAGVLSGEEWTYYDWIAIGAIAAAALWLCQAIIANLPALIELLKAGAVKRLVEAARRCGDCGTPIVEGGRFCHRCGTAG